MKQNNSCYLFGMYEPDTDSIVVYANDSDPFIINCQKCNSSVILNNPDDIVYDDGTYENKIMMFKKAAHILGLEVSDCLIIEDSLSGIENAYKAGCRNIIVIDSANKKDEYQKLPGVTKVIDTFKEI